MLLRFFTSLLLLTMLLPVGVFGAGTHRCEGEKSVSKMSCCQGSEYGHLAANDSDQLTHRCQIQAVTVVQQPASLSHKAQIDAASFVDADFSTIPTLLRLTEHFCNTSFPRVSHHSSRGKAPVFLRTCSFLI